MSQLSEISFISVIEDERTIGLVLQKEKCSKQEFEAQVVFFGEIVQALPN